MGQPAQGLLAAATAGNVDKIYELAYEAGGGGGGDEDDEYGGDDNIEADEVAYFWLLVAGDFGHKKADSAIQDMHQSSSFRYDDDNMVSGLVHLDVAQAYLKGAEGLAVDLEKARTHLDTAKELQVHISTDVAGDFPSLRKKLKPEALAVFDAVFPDKGAKKSAKKPAAKKSAKKPVAKKSKKPKRRS